MKCVGAEVGRSISHQYRMADITDSGGSSMRPAGNHFTKTFLAEDLTTMSTMVLYTFTHQKNKL